MREPSNAPARRTREADRTERLLSGSEERYRLLFDQNPLPLWVFDAETLAFLAVNEAAVHSYGYSRDEFLAMTIKEIRPPEDVPRLLDPISNLPAHFHQGPCRHRKKDGTVVDVDITSNAVLFGVRPARLVMALDVTQRLRAEERLKRSESLLLEAQRVAHLGIWEWDVVRDIVAWSGELCRILGVDPRDAILDYGTCLRSVHPEDRDMADEVVRRALEDGRPFNFHHRMVRPDGTVRWVDAHGEVLRDASGHPVRMVGTAQDVTDRVEAGAALRASEERFRLLVEGVKDYAIFMLDPEGHVVSWTGSAVRIHGYRAEEILGRHFSCFYPEEEVLRGRPQAVLQTAAEAGRAEDEGWCARRDGSRFWASVVITALRDPEGRLQGFSKVTRDMTERKKAEDSLREISGRLLRLQTEERRRIARELHDSTAQSLAALAMNLSAVGKAAGALSEAARTRLAESLKLAEQCCQEIRTLSYLLHPPVLQEGDLWSAVRWYAEGFMHRSGIRVDLSVPSKLERLPEEVETTLFRIVQESLTNIHRHSGSRTARIRIARASDKVTLVVRDDGRGVEGAEAGEAGAPAALGVGIAGMRERVQQLGGQFEIDLGRRGTRVKVMLPLERAH